VTSTTGTREFTVPDSLAGIRLDKVAAQLAEGLSRARVETAIDEGAVRVNGRKRPKGSLVDKGDVIAIDLGEVADPEAPCVASPTAQLVVRLETPKLLIVDKPAGQPTAPLRPGETGTLANALLGHFPELAGVGYGPREPGVVHRLDTDTSGLLIVARDTETFDALKAALKDDRIEKTYLLVCAYAGLAETGTIEFPITNHPKDQRRVYACVHPRDVMRYSPRPASTSYKMIAHKGDYALVEVKVARALRHQIRAHFAAIDHPLIGDWLYGGPVVEGLGRHALHASRIAFVGSPEIAAFDVESPLPPELKTLVY
jgi:23S rRNA pseudouridine1911/1915/1917 synthase